MCKSCGCAAGHNKQLELHIPHKEGRSGLQDLHSLLMGAPGILNVTVNEISDQVLIDFSPQRTSQQDIENLVTDNGYSPLSAEVRELTHQHGVVAFFKRIVGK